MPRSGVQDTQRHLLAELRRLGPAGLRRFQRDLRASARKNALTYVLEDGRTVIMPLLAAPALLPAGEIAYLHRLCQVFYDAFRRTAVARRSDPAVRALLPLDPEEEEWLALAPARIAPLVGRFDMNVDPERGGARGARLLELNGCAIGGIHYGPATSRTLLEHVGPLANGRMPRMPDAMSEVWIDLCLGHARSLGRRGLRLVWLEDRDWEAGITEGPTLVEQLRRAGHTAGEADPRDIGVRRGEICVRGRPVDVIYRGMDVRDLIAIEAESGRLRGMREAVRRGHVLSPMEGDLDHKSLLELWSSARFAHLFTAAQRTLLRRHVPWTRKLGGRRVDDPDGRMVDLPEYVARNRTRLVIKPNRACGGEGILIGKDTSPSRWQRTIDRALSGAEPGVAQEFIRGARVRSPVVRKGRIEIEDHFTNYGLLASPRRLGILGRAAPFPVVNVSRGGGVLGVLLV